MTISLISNGLCIDQGAFRYAWYQLDMDGRVFYRAVAFKELVTLTMDPRRENEGILGIQWGAIRGLYNAGINFVYTACGIFEPGHIGIVQLYGAAANASSEEEAAARALQMAESVQGSMANFAQSRMKSPDLDVMRWYVDFLTRSRNILVVLGHPDPRVKLRASGSQDGNLPEESLNDLANEQNEILFRGMAKNRENFIFQVTSKALDRNLLADGLIRVSQAASNFASRQRGSKSISMGLGLPIVSSISQAVSGGNSLSDSYGQSVSDGASHGWGNSQTDSWSHTDSQSSSHGISVSHGVSQGVSDGTSHTTSQADSVGHTDSTSHTVSHSTSDSSGSGSSWGNSWSASMSQGTNVGMSAILNFGGSYGITQGASHSAGGSSFSSHTETNGTADSTGRADSTSHTEGVSNGTTHGVSSGTTDTVSESWSTSVGSSDSYGGAKGSSESWGESRATGESYGQSNGRSASQALGGGFSGGLAPTISMGRSWQTEDDVAIRLTELLRGLEGQANVASSEGGFMTDVLLFTGSKAGESLAAALVPQAFHGQGVPRPVMTVAPALEDQDQLIEHARAFLPYTRFEQDDPFGGFFWSRYGTMLNPKQVAAYSAPSVLQEGTLKVIEPIPHGMGFFPNMPGMVMLGHQYSPSTGDLTTTQVRLDKPLLMHTIFAANTGMGKSVAAQRMVYEMAKAWNMRIVVLDFGFAWRSLLNAPGLKGRVDIRQLRPDGVRPLRWNPMQIGTLINPETQLKAFVDIFGSIAQLGQKQQQHRLLDALRQVYMAKGVLVDDPEVRRDPEWGHVRPAEALQIGASAGLPLSDLTLEQRQLLAVYRSKVVGLMDLYTRIETDMNALKANDQVGRGVLEGILWRLRGLTRGGAAAQFAANTPGDESIPVEDLGRPNGVVILEGGKFLDNFTKAWLLGWAGWMIYTDMVARREKQINQGQADLFMVFEEANIIFSGTDGKGAEGESSGQSVSEQYSNMFRDSRKYGAFFGVITQSPSLIPPGILTSCNNVCVGFLTAPKDKDVMLSALAKSEKGFTDESWRRFLSFLAIGQIIARFPYAGKREQQLPFLFRPLILNVPEPTDSEIDLKLGRITLR